MEAKPVFPLSGRAVLLRDGRRQENCLRSGGKTSAPHLSEMENSVVMRLLRKAPS
jgi:hypothetical protein